MKAFALTDVGQMRDCNQDYVFCSEAPVGILPNLFIVADGMGGHTAGDFASRFCVEEFIHQIKEKPDKTVVTTIEKAIRETNEQLIRQAKEHAELDGMGTTFVLASFFGDRLCIANIGDSRLYRISEKMEQITMDHSLVAEMVRNGDLNEEAARFHPNKNIVTRALSTSGVVIPDFFEVVLHSGDVVMLCSDGLFSMLENHVIFDIINEHRQNPEEACRELVRRANENGGKDNISVIIITDLPEGNISGGMEKMND